MEPVPRHCCLIYEGPPSRHLHVVAPALIEMLHRGCRCLYLNSPELVRAMRSTLEEKGLKVEKEIARGSLMLTSERSHLADGRFDADLMMHSLDQALQQALNDGYNGLWATGDMSWEFGPAQDFSQLLEYEWQLEEYFLSHPELGGVCQYHADTLPREVMRHGLVSHPSIFINKTLSLLNPHYLHPGSFPTQTEIGTVISVVESSLDRLLDLEFAL